MVRYTFAGTKIKEKDFKHRAIRKLMYLPWVYDTNYFINADDCLHSIHSHTRAHTFMKMITQNLLLILIRFNFSFFFFAFYCLNTYDILNSFVEYVHKTLIPTLKQQIEINTHVWTVNATKLFRRRAKITIIKKQRQNGNNGKKKKPNENYICENFRILFVYYWNSLCVRDLRHLFQCFITFFGFKSSFSFAICYFV